MDASFSFSFKTIKRYIKNVKNIKWSIMKVKVTTLTRDKHKLEVAPHDTIRDLKVSTCLLWKQTFLFDVSKNINNVNFLYVTILSFCYRIYCN